MSKDIDTPAADTAKINKMRDAAHMRLPIHTDTQQEIDQAEQRKTISRNPETGEVMPVSIATLEGGDGEGVYVSAKQYVALECYPLSAKLTPKAALLVAHDLVAAVEALDPSLTSMVQSAPQIDGVSHADVTPQCGESGEGFSNPETPIEVDGHFGPVWASRTSVDRDQEGRADSVNWLSEAIDVPTSDVPLTLTVERYDQRTEGVWIEGAVTLFIDNAELDAQQVAVLLPALTKLQGNLTPTSNPSQPVEVLVENSPGGPVAMPAWAKEVDQEGGLLVWTADASVSATNTYGKAITPTLAQSDTTGVEILRGVPTIFPFGTDDLFTIPEALKLADAIYELCDKAGGAE